MPQPRNVQYRKLKPNLVRRPPLPQLARQLETALANAAKFEAEKAEKAAKKSRSRRS